MAIDAPTFLLGYPEFNDAPPTLIAAKLSEATDLIAGPVWNPGAPGPDLTQQATFLQLAHLLALSPFARHMALVGTDGKTLYSERLAGLKRIVASGYRVT